MSLSSPSSADLPSAPEPARRDFLFIATAAVAGVGAAATLWPFIDQMNPDAATEAAAEPIDVDVGQIQPGQQIVVLWSARPVFIVNRTKEALDALRDPALLARLSDPNSTVRQQPPYAANWHRSSPARVPGPGRHLHASRLHPQVHAQARSERSRAQIGRAAISAPAMARNTTSRAGSSPTFRRPTISRCRRIIFPTPERCASAKTPAAPISTSSSIVQV